jgi:hypothetical protein
MYATNSSRGEYFDPGGSSENQSRGDRCRAIGTLDHRYPKVAARDLPDTSSAKKSLEVAAGEAERRASA